MFQLLGDGIFPNSLLNKKLRNREIKCLVAGYTLVWIRSVFLPPSPTFWINCILVNMWLRDNCNINGSLFYWMSTILFQMLYKTQFHPSKKSTKNFQEVTWLRGTELFETMLNIFSRKYYSSQIRLPNFKCHFLGFQNHSLSLSLFFPPKIYFPLTLV